MLQPLRSSIYAFKTDFVVASWVARLQPNELPAARSRTRQRRIFQSGDPRFRRQALDTRALDKPIDVLMDVEPRNAETMTFLGRSFDQDPVLGPMLARAMTEGKPVASDPMPLLRPNGPVGLVLAAPVLQEGAARLRAS